MAFQHPVGFLSKSDVRNMPLAKTGQTLSEDDEIWHDGWRRMDICMYDVRRTGTMGFMEPIDARDSAGFGKLYKRER